MVLLLFLFTLDRNLWHILQLHMARYRTAGGGWGSLHQTEIGVRVQPWRCLHKKAFCDLHFKQCIGFYLPHLTVSFLLFYFFYCTVQALCVRVFVQLSVPQSHGRARVRNRWWWRSPALFGEFYQCVFSLSPVLQLRWLHTFVPLLEAKTLSFGMIAAMCCHYPEWCWPLRVILSDRNRNDVVISQNDADQWGSFWVIETIMMLSLARMMLTSEGHSEW